jgi:uncharacterized LabA/DUF88 family protein
MPEKVVLLLDGGFVKKKLSVQSRRFPTERDIVSFCGVVMEKPRLLGKELFRAYYYDAPPLEGTATNPIDGTTIDFSQTSQASRNKALLDSLEFQPDFAVRKGSLLRNGWKLGDVALRNILQSNRQVTARDLVPDIVQKGVDIRIGLDIASIALKKFADVLVLVTGDSDLIPAMKFARKEGMKVYLECMGHPVTRDLKVHADFVL